MKLAVLADIHGNAPALEAVLEDFAGRDFDAVVNLGDAFNGPIDPAGVMRRLRATPMLHVRGNGERMVLADEPEKRTRSATFARERLSAQDLRWIATWPAVVEHAEFFACHGSPASDEEYLLEEPKGDSVRLRAGTEIAASLGGQCGLVLCGHSHVPRFVAVTEGTWVLNPGSVGLPAYALTSPMPHAMQVGSPCARYAVAVQRTAGWRVCHVALPYDHERAAAAADEAGFAEWARSLRTGYAG